MQVKKQQLELDMKQWTGSKLGKEYIKPVYCHPVYLTYSEYITQNARLDEAQAGIKIARRNINKLKYADDTTLMVESGEELNSLLMKVKEYSENAGLNSAFIKAKIMASSPITSWQIEKIEKWKQWQTLFSWTPKSLGTVAAVMKFRHLLLGRKAMTNIDNVLKS